ncbi:MAG TPA: protoporphyrinogen oxidase [Myxococcales bacterium]|jgi:oxygen-dependent protoporphyrinogen oxidase
MRPVVVIGAGVSGLATALALVRRGIPARVLEESDRVGGSLRTGRAEGYQYELGPYALFDNEPKLRELIEQVGLAAKLQHASSASGTRHLVLHGALKPLPPGPKMLTGGPLSFGARMRLLMEVVSSRPASDDESVLDFGRRHVGDEVTRLLLEPFVGLLYAGDLARLSAKSCFPALYEVERRHGSLVRGVINEYRQGLRAGAWLPVGGNVISFDGGLEELPRAMAARLGDGVRLRTAAARVWPSADGVRIELASGEEVSAASAVLAVPASVGAQLLSGCSPQAEALLKQVPYAPLAVVHLGFPVAEVSANLRAFGFLVPSSEGLPLRGCVFTSSLFPGRAPEGHCLLSVVLGGARMPDIVVQPEEALVRMASSAVRRLLGIPKEPVFAKASTWPQALPQYEVGTERRNAALRSELSRLGPVFFAGNAWDGAFVGECVRRADAIAEQVAAQLKRHPRRTMSGVELPRA